MKRKGIVTFALALILMCLMAGCSSDNPGDVSATATPAPDGGVLSGTMLPALPNTNATNPGQATTPPATFPDQTTPNSAPTDDGLLGTQAPGGVTTTD